MEEQICSNCMFWKERIIPDKEGEWRKCSSARFFVAIYHHNIPDKGDNRLRTYQNFGCRYWREKPIEAPKTELQLLKNEICKLIDDMEKRK